MPLYETEIASLDGTPGLLAAQEGKVTLMVNVASKCGLTPQYTGLEKIHEEYAARGFSVLVLTLEGDRISAITWFADSGVFPQFGLPRMLPG